MDLQPLRWVCKLGCVSVLGLALAGCGSALSKDKEVQLGKQAAPKFEQEGGGPIPDPQVQQYVSSVGRDLLRHIPAERRDLPWEFFTLDSEIVNAFALPGGKVFVTRGLLSRLENEAEMAGVIGHEIGHVVAQHIGKQMSRQMGIETALGVAGAVSDSQLVNLLGGGAGKLYLLKFSRGQELEADRLGMDFMYRAGYRPGQMRKVMLVLKQISGGRGGAFTQMLSTHPDPDARLKQANELVRSKYPETIKNPAFKDNAQQYRTRMLDRLKQLPPPRQRAKG